MTDYDISHLLMIQEKYNAMIEKRKELNKKYLPAWKSSIGEEEFKQKRKIANKKYADKMKEKRNQLKANN